MSERIRKVNKHLQRTFGEILQREADVPPDVLVTISHVDTTPNLKSADVWLYINPIERASEIIDRLTPQLYDLQGALNRVLDFRPLPRLRLRIDYGAQHAENIERTIADLKHDAGPASPPGTDPDR